MPVRWRLLLMELLFRMSHVNQWRHTTNFSEGKFHFELTQLLLWCIRCSKHLNFINWATNVPQRSLRFKTIWESSKPGLLNTKRFEWRVACNNVNEVWVRYLPGYHDHHLLCAIVKFRLLHLDRLPHSQKLQAKVWNFVAKSPQMEKFCMLPQCASLKRRTSTFYLIALMIMKGESERKLEECWLYVTVHNCSSNRIIFKSCLKAQTCLIAVNVIRVSVSQSNGDPIFGVTHKRWSSTLLGYLHCVCA